MSTDFGLIIGGKNLYSAGIKPLLAFAQGLLEKEFSVVLYLTGTNANSLKRIREKLYDYDNFKGIYSGDKIVEEFNSSTPSVVISDDYETRLKFSTKLVEKKSAKLCIYSQVFGRLDLLTDNETGVPKPTQDKKYETWKTFSKEHSKNLQKANAVISNSYYTELNNLLLFGVSTNTVIYPPIDTKIFSYSRNSESKKITIYVGNEEEKAIYSITIISSLLKSGYKLIIFGSLKSIRDIKRSFDSNEIEYMVSVDPETLHNAYVDSIITIVTPKWESFGNVPVESILSGTPAIAPNYQPWMELITDNTLYMIDRNFKALTENTLIDAVTNYYNRIGIISESIRNKVSIDSSTRSLINMLSQLNIL